MRYRPSGEELERVESCLARGIAAGAAKLIRELGQKGALAEMKAEEKKSYPGPEGAPRRLVRAEARARLKELKKLYESGKWAEVERLYEAGV